ncbi:MAG: HlyD family efflux transporter periplasmic adaptor subunit [Planctomycetes bacterium]|nr:HlyD family efflux transporter periplasmic adaptor subunit [Planctomycetota bacterium]
MSILTSKPLYRFSQLLALFFFPAAIFFLFFFTLEDKVKTSGVVEAANQIVVRSAVEKTIVEAIHYQNGDKVTQGSPVVTFADLQGLETQVKKLKLHLEFLQEQLQRAKRLQSEGAGSSLKVEELTNEIREEEIALEELRTQQERLVARAPFDGNITNIHVKLQERAEIGKPLFTLFGTGDKIIRCIVPEQDFDYLAIGQEVQIKSQLYNYLRYQIYNGRVLSISKYGKHAVELSDPDNYDELKIYYTVLVELLDGQDKLAVGSSAMCEIIIERRPVFYIIVGWR